MQVAKRLSSQDDRYYEVADRIIKLKVGKVGYDEAVSHTKKAAADLAFYLFTRSRIQPGVIND
jgi:hypothetical protein